MHLAELLRKILPEINMCVIAPGLQLVTWTFSPGDRSKGMGGWPLHLLSHLNSSLWSSHSWHGRDLLKTRHLSSIVPFLILEMLGPEPLDLRRDHERS